MIDNGIQMSIFESIYENYIIKKPIRLIEMFGGIGSQYNALKFLGANVEHYKLIEWSVNSIQAYNDIHIQDHNDYSKEYTKEQLQQILFNYGISNDYNAPMTFKQICRRKDEWLRTVYNNIVATKNLVNIQQVKGKDLEIVDKDKYEYIITYSFPCQDLSLAGLRKGMSRDGGTRSGMLWEVERILDECNSLEQLPQVLLMENVPQVHGKGNLEHFIEWQKKLESLGYKNYWQDLIATNYGIPQTRNRTFMVSILGNHKFNFPNTIPLKLKLKDMLEKNVDEKYYLSSKQLEQISNWNSYQNPFDTIDKENCPTLTTRSGAFAASMVLTKENDVIKHSYTSNKLDDKRLVPSHNVSPTLDTRADCLGVTTKEQEQLRIRKLTPKETFRLMGFKDKDYDNASKNLSDNNIYHIAGDSIVVTVLMAIFGELLEINWKEIVEARNE